MSVVRSTELSAASYGNLKLYSLKGSSESSALSNQSISSDKHKIMYANDAYSSKSYEPDYFLDSPTEDLVISSSSGVSGTPFRPRISSSAQL